SFYGRYRKTPINQHVEILLSYRKKTAYLSRIVNPENWELRIFPIVSITFFDSFCNRQYLNRMKRPEPNQAIKVAIADDHALFRAGVKTALAVKKDVELIAEADNGQQLLHLLKHVEPDVILLDIQMPIMDGIQTLPEIRKDHPHVKVIILSMHNDHSMISKLMEIGANSYLTKNSDSETIYQAIKTCYEQEFFFNELTNKALLTGLRTKRPEVGAVADVNLTEKELTVLKLMCEEKTTKEIADIVDI